MTNKQNKRKKFLPSLTAEPGRWRLKPDISPLRHDRFMFSFKLILKCHWDQNFGIPYLTAWKGKFQLKFYSFHRMGMIFGHFNAKT